MFAENFIFDKTNKGQIDYSTFKNYALIILNQLQDISSGLSSSLKEYVENGGTYLVQYNVNRPLVLDQIGPYPFKISRDA